MHLIHNMQSTLHGAEVDRRGHVKVASDLTVPGHPNIFVIGDTATLNQNGKPLPGVAQVAIQQGQYAAAVIAARVAGKKHRQPFHYWNKGTLATIGRSYAIADLGPIRLAGLAHLGGRASPPPDRVSQSLCDALSVGLELLHL